MTKHWKMLATLALGLGLVGCGTTVGDACTTANDCGGDGALCITTRGYLPGGYCSQACVPGNDETCPSGTTCIREGASGDVSACYLRCESNDDCRDGYKCVGGVRDNPYSVCVGLSYDD
jgi:hypothetical protein